MEVRYQPFASSKRVVPRELKDKKIEIKSLDGETLLTLMYTDNFIEAALSDSLLPRANLRGACLRGVFLSGADLRGADLSYTDLSHANFYETNLKGANLQGANLYNVNFINAIFDKADLRGAQVNLDQLKDEAKSYKGIKLGELPSKPHSKRRSKK